MNAWSTAVPDWESRVLQGRSLVPALPLFDKEADKAVRIFSRLRLPDVVGTPTMAEAFGPWVFDIVRAVFGSYDPETKRRMLQEFFLLIPKKNAKSTIAAAIMVVAIIMNRRPLAEFLLVAPTKEIADISFKQASGIIALDTELKKLFHPQRHIRTITHRRTGATIQIKAADTDVITGSKATGTLIDETHVFSKKSNARDVFVEIRGALAARPDGFLLQISTQSKEQPSGVFRSELNKARDVRDGLLEFPMLAVLYELPVKYAKEWKDEAFWPLLNPNIDRSVDRAFLERELRAAEREGEEQLALFASQHFNVEIGQGLRTGGWVGAKYWAECADLKITVEYILENCDCVTVGIDGGGLDDLLALAACGRHKITRDWLFAHKTWAHRGVLKLRKSIAQKLLDFEKAGELIFFDEIGEDVSQVVDEVMRFEEAGLLPDKNAVGLDPVGISEIVDELESRGITVESGKIVGVKQGWTLSNTIKTTERRLAGMTLKHPGQQIVGWAVDNAKEEPRGNAKAIDKSMVGTGKIDPLVAIFDAVALMAMNPQAQVSVYDQLAAAEAEQPDDEKVLSPDEEAAILGNPAHPMWAKVRDAWELKNIPQEQEVY